MVANKDGKTELVLRDLDQKPRTKTPAVTRKRTRSQEAREAERPQPVVKEEQEESLADQLADSEPDTASVTPPLSPESQPTTTQVKCEAPEETEGPTEARASVLPTIITTTSKHSLAVPSCRGGHFTSPLTPPSANRRGRRAKSGKAALLPHFGSASSSPSFVVDPTPMPDPAAAGLDASSQQMYVGASVNSTTSVPIPIKTERTNSPSHLPYGMSDPSTGGFYGTDQRWAGLPPQVPLYHSLPSHVPHMYGSSPYQTTTTSTLTPTLSPMSPYGAMGSSPNHFLVPSSYHRPMNDLSSPVGSFHSQHLYQLPTPTPGSYDVSGGLDPSSGEEAWFDSEVLSGGNDETPSGLAPHAMTFSDDERYLSSDADECSGMTMPYTPSNTFNTPYEHLVPIEPLAFFDETTFVLDEEQYSFESFMTGCNTKAQQQQQFQPQLYQSFSHNPQPQSQPHSTPSSQPYYQQPQPQQTHAHYHPHMYLPVPDSSNIQQRA
eukprot:TRINITY_DN2492_c0_g1_i2.p1 TRINITY_DN2492_c0_g1~~TRINITY_DN2492_c0_g1_i2.p1  ORF type:complete len:491 (+),score=81.56 TRINITY_DN2492_c0_g1_i2:680-2152(+)